MNLAYDGLVAYRRVGGAAGAALVANLAAQIPAPTGGGGARAFQLRPGIRYSNGAPVRPDDLCTSLGALLPVHVNQRRVPGIVGAAACLREPTTCDLSQGIETNDEARTVTIHLTAPDPDFLNKLALPFASVVPAWNPLRVVGAEPMPRTGPIGSRSAEPDRRSGSCGIPLPGLVSTMRGPTAIRTRWHSDLSNDVERPIAAVEADEADSGRGRRPNSVQGL